ncbi:MAG: zinc-binding dehydrogenase [Phycisphaerales bacterium]|nr:zinc-binding dehydrogenase [Phycisphaerales bacterium]
MQALVYDISPHRWLMCKVASAFSKQAFHGPLSGLRLVERPVPEIPGPGWVRLKTILGGVCGTDLALIMQRNHPATILRNFAGFPAVLGHENVALIDEVGADVPDWRPGQRVCADPALGCLGRGIEPCSQCAAGRSSICEHPGNKMYPPRALLGLNPQTGGSWAGYFLAHHTQLHAVPEGLSHEAAILVDPIASAAHAVLRRPPEPGETVLVNGSGIIALGVIASIRSLGCDNPVTAIVRHPFQAELAREMGSTTVLRHPRGLGKLDRYETVAKDCQGVRLSGSFGNQILIGGYDLAYECTGDRRGLTAVVKWTRGRGTVVAAGTTGIARIDTTPIWFDELTLIGANGRQVEDVDGVRRHSYDLVLDWLAKGRLDLSALRVARYSLSHYRGALRDLMNRSRNSIVKAVFEP